jgi:hypothetical protein
MLGLLGVWGVGGQRGEEQLPAGSPHPQTREYWPVGDEALGGETLDDHVALGPDEFPAKASPFGKVRTSPSASTSSQRASRVNISPIR